jgi:LDH2 family malate/lactate/ureidoglycolate dehydrogenase
MVGMAMTSGTSNAMAPWGGTTPLLSNNPMAVAIPCDECFPVVLDMAMSVAARGKIILAAQAGKPIPPDWALTTDGEPTTDTAEAVKGLLRPVGDYKGSGLALVVAVLTAILTGGAFGREIKGFYENVRDPHNTGHLLLAIRIAHFLPLRDFKTRMDAVVRELKSSQRARGVQEILLPGEQEFLMAHRREREGIPMPASLVAGLDALAESLGMPAELNLSF